MLKSKLGILVVAVIGLSIATLWAQAGDPATTPTTVLETAAPATAPATAPETAAPAAAPATPAPAAAPAGPSPAEIAAKQQLALEQEAIKGFLTQLKSPRDEQRVLAINNIFGAYSNKKISEKTIVPLLIDTLGDKWPRVSTTAFARLQAVTGQKFENKKELWQKWWTDKLLQEQAAAADPAAGDAAPAAADPAAVVAALASAAAAAGAQALMDQHNADLGGLDRFNLKNGRELLCYILTEVRDENDIIVRYVVRFKDAMGEAEILPSEIIGEPQRDIDLSAGQLPVPVEPAAP